MAFNPTSLPARILYFRPPLLTGYNQMVIRQYVDQALRRAHYDKLEDGTFCAEVAELQGVLATGSMLEECRDQLAEVVEEWVLVRVARALAVPPLDDIEVKVQTAV